MAMAKSTAEWTIMAVLPASKDTMGIMKTLWFLLRQLSEEQQDIKPPAKGSAACLGLTIRNDEGVDTVAERAGAGAAIARMPRVQA